jgi:hypothetical protein
MYDQGYGVSHNNLKVLILFELAASQGDDLSVPARHTVADQMTPADISRAEPLALECTEKSYKGRVIFKVAVKVR